MREIAMQLYDLFGVATNPPQNLAEFFPWLATLLLAVCVIATCLKMVDTMSRFFYSGGRRFH